MHDAGIHSSFPPARSPLGHKEVDSVLKGGLAQGALHEVFAAETGAEAAAGGFVAALSLRAAAGKPLLWIRQDFAALEYGELSAIGLLELGLDPRRLLLLRVGDVASALKAAGDALSCAALGAVIIETSGMAKILDLATSRRLMLAAARKGVSVFLLRLSAQPQPSAAETRWLVRPARSRQQKDDWGFPRFAAALLRNRHGATGEWVMEWNSDRGLFGAPDGAAGRTAIRAPHPGVVVSLSGDGSPQAARDESRAGKERAA